MQTCREWANVGTAACMRVQFTGYSACVAKVVMFISDIAKVKIPIPPNAYKPVCGFLGSIKLISGYYLIVAKYRILVSTYLILYISIYFETKD